MRGIAKRVRVLDFAQVWPGAPKGADVTDWKRQREGDRDELLALVPKLPDWRPPPFVSQFGGIPFERLAVRIRHHQHIARESALSDDGDESIVPEVHGLNPIFGAHFGKIPAPGCIVKSPVARVCCAPCGGSRASSRWA